jgi:hypothetical protein
MDIEQLIETHIIDKIVFMLLTMGCRFINIDMIAHPSSTAIHFVAEHGEEYARTAFHPDSKCIEIQCVDPNFHSIVHYINFGPSEGVSFSGFGKGIANEISEKINDIICESKASV